MNYGEFKTELKNRGFDGFSDDDLGRYVNWGYFYVAKKFPWYWEQTTFSFTIPVGQYSIATTSIPNFRALDYVTVTTEGYRGVLEGMKQEVFFKQWLALDLESSDNRGEPSNYFVYEAKLFILPPPTTDRDFIVHYRQRVAVMAEDTDTPLTPAHLDEAIVLAALARCHRRANELALAAQVEVDLMEFFDDMYTDEEFQMAQVQDRILPDDTWL
jgi:hypothetical protein